MKRIFQMLFGAVLAISMNMAHAMFDNEYSNEAGSWANPQLTTLTELFNGQYARGGVGDNDTYQWSFSPTQPGQYFVLNASAPSMLGVASGDGVSWYHLAANVNSQPFSATGTYRWVFNGDAKDQFGNYDVTANSIANFTGCDCDQYYLSARDPAGSFAAPVPEPETYALFLAGIGVIAFQAKRRRKE